MIRFWFNLKTGPIRLPLLSNQATPINYPFLITYPTIHSATHMPHILRRPHTHRPNESVLLISRQTQQIERCSSQLAVKAHCIFCICHILFVLFRYETCTERIYQLERRRLAKLWLKPYTSRCKYLRGPETTAKSRHLAPSPRATS